MTLNTYVEGTGSRCHSPSTSMNYRQQQQMLPISLKGETEVVGIQMQCHMGQKNLQEEHLKTQGLSFHRSQPYDSSAYLLLQLNRWLQML